MNSRKVVFLFFTTLLIGSVSGAIVGLILDYDMYVEGSFLNLVFGVVWLLGISAAFTLISQMGFFAYLTVHRFGLGLFKSHKLWNAVQLILVAFVIFDLIYFRYIAFVEEGQTIFGYMVMPILLLAYGLVVAYLKARDTHEGAFVPALFFMVVVTTIEWVPALTVNDPKWLWLYLTPLLFANTYQLLILHRLTKQPVK
ncbi:KinB-signaling pathway activation protein [Halalkalibacter sp. APA_J-10(15)]|uniref:KinB-signaling pathway activation protein n=1 Tax=unclassified Halalkalibacter TaxID=2893063 RepID=UPI001FF559D3|nr:KinB-signaling pathway activation protein [Halalkalibacter sp. APA_J-10(15)]MCK0473405.1 KinB-signaling pathway activation protein [Halalkalibacter sp. APA_J-10(15)]